MDAGGLILNLADEDTQTFSQPSPSKGGRWTERLKAKKAAKRVVKRKIPDDDEDRSTNPTAVPKRARTEKNSLPSESTRPPTQIISSLFTSNPVIAKPANVTPAFVRPVKPSNAPIDTSTFEGLGLSPLIISHLSDKMSISQPTAIQQATLPTLLTTEERDAFIQSQTGSGKTLSFLLPILQDLLPLSSLSYIDRSIGTLAVIIAPTRELAKQIYDVLEQLLKLRLRPRSDDPEQSFENSERLTRWLVPGLLTGGATKAHEKARLRKGLPIIVATPGRLLDHLQNTASLDVGKCRWLVLDEADRLMELGFEETIQGILKSLNGRRRLAIQAEEEGNVRIAWEWRERRTVLCSATIREDVQKLAGMALNNPVLINALQSHSDPQPAPQISHPGTESGTKFTPPSQLLQKYIIAPLKLRLVTLVALLRSLLSAASRKHNGVKIIVFFSCTDSVDFHWSLLSGSKMGHQDPIKDRDDASQTDEEESDEEATEHVKAESAILPQTNLYRLHGSLSLQSRLSSLKGFSSKSKSNDPDSSHSAVLFCTSVASRGLDLPFVRAVVQYDLPTEGGGDEYVHRVGRTARVGEGGEAWAFVAPSEEKWVPWMEQHMGSLVLQPVAMSTVLENGFGGRGKEMEMRATQVQLAFERWVLQNAKNSELARRAYSSHMRAYSTHPTKEKHIFHIRHLHLGHLAKAFALREAPNAAAHANNNKPKSKSRKSKKANDKGTLHAEERMSAVVRQQGRLTKKDGAFVAADASEFQIASTDALETLVRR